MIFSIRLSLGQLERPDDDAGVGRLEDDPGALDVHVGELPTSIRGCAARPGHVRTLPRLAECRQGAFQQVHLGEGEQEGEGRFGPLVPVDPVLLEAVAAAAGAWVVEVLAQVVAAEEPLEGRAGLVQPGGVLGGPVGLQAGRDRRVGLDRLLVELGPLAAPCGRSRCSRSAGSAPAGPSGSRPASPASASRPPGPGRCRCRGRWRSGPAAAGRCRSSGSPRTRASRAWPSGRRGRSAGPSACRGPGAASRSPPNRRRYSRMPSRPKAQVRGEVVSRSAGRARSKCDGGPGRQVGPPRPADAGAEGPEGPAVASPPSRPPPASGGRSSGSCGTASGRGRRPPGGTRRRSWPAGGPRGPSWPSSSRSTVSSRARALSSVQ